MRAVSLHRDVVVVTSAIWQTSCTIVRDGDELFVIDSPILPDELEMLPAVCGRLGPQPSGLLATHADWDHLLGPLAFPQAALGCAESTAQRLSAEPGAAVRGLRAFDDEHYVAREGTLTLTSFQALPVPGRCDIGARELALHPTGGHTADGMAIAIDWARVLVVGDYLSPAEIPAVTDAARYLATLERLRPLLAAAAHIVPGHGAVLTPSQAGEILDQDSAYVNGLLDGGAATPLPRAQRSAAQRRRHHENVAALEEAR